MRFRKTVALTLIATASANPTLAANYCAPFSDAADILPLEFVDRADPITARVAQPVEEQLLDAQIANTEAGPLQKHYCQIGMFGLNIRFVQPVLDDAVQAIVTEATYTWDAGQDPAGWVLSGLRNHPACARGPTLFAPICN